MNKEVFKNKKVLIPVIIAVVVLVLGVGGFTYYSSSLGAVSSSKDPVVFEVKTGETSETILANLKANNLIKNTTMAKLYMKMNGLSDMKAGNFSIDRSMSTKEILEILNDTTKAKDEQVQITFKEGMWAKDVASEVESKLGVSKDELLTLWNDDTYLSELMKSYPFLTKDILNSQYRVKLEGYLFPETYTFKKDATAKEVTITFLDHFGTIYDKYKNEISKSGYSVQEIVTLSSVVQYEAAKKSDMDMIAGVFYNRLKQNMPLQSSVTVCYALYDNLTSSDDCEIQTDINSPYNTYQVSGLPIGPILNPGEEAIHAVLNPKDSEYLYFVADIYGDGTVYYAKTLNEQEANIDKYGLRK